MRAFVYEKYGPPEVLRLEEVPRPVPNDDEVLVKVHATTVNRTDTGLRSAEYFISRFVTGLLRPKNKVLGMEFAGEVVEAGAAVTQFKVGDEVFGAKAYGAHAEFLAVPQSAAVALKPAAMPFEEAAAVTDGVMLALACLRKAGPLEGRSIVIYGASGSIGTAAVQLAKHFGADATAVCATRNLELVRSLGADAVVDYTQEDFTRNGKKYDVIFDAVGMHSFRRSRRSLKRGGTYIETDLGFMWHVPLFILLTRWVGDKKVKMGIPHYTKEDVLFLKELIEAGKYRAVIDRTYPLEDMIEAVRFVETGQKTGNVVVTVADE
jgi:2-desacetyl-2-hydroxyethyl bacteriochlorophyllide A dehydrogenase